MERDWGMRLRRTMGVLPMKDVMLGRTDWATGHVFGGWEEAVEGAEGEALIVVMMAVGVV